MGLGDDHRRGGRLSHKALPCPFFGVTPSLGRGGEYQNNPLSLSWCYTELGQGRGV